MLRKSKFFILIFSFSMLCGCAMDMYDSNYSCPQNEFGQCVPIEQAHDKALSSNQDKVISDYSPDPIQERKFLLEDVKNFESTMLAYETCVKSNNGDASKCEKERQAVSEYYRSAEERGRAKEIHGMAMQERVAKLAAMEQVVSGGSNVVPVRQPDTVMEVFIMPYATTSGNLVSERVMWVVVEPGQWVWATKHGKGSKYKLGETR